MTRKLYWEDAYLKQFSAKVQSVTESGGIILGQTAFYPTSGGQPNDTGTMVLGNETFTVKDVKKTGDDVIHILDRQPADPIGKEVKCTIDWDRRYGHMRHHTAIHIIDGIIEKEYKGTATGGQIYSNRARIDFDLPGLNTEMATEIIKKAQAVVDENHKTSARIVTQADALQMPNLARTEPGRELIKMLPEVRVLDIVGFDEQMDGGTHVASTKEIGTIKLNKIENRGTHSKRMEISLV